MDLYGRFLTGPELRRRVGRLEQVAGVEPLVLDDGPARGVHAVRVRTGSGLSFLVLENPALAGGLAFSVRFRPEELPEFVQWTMTGEGAYVLGLEPATCRVGGYEVEEAAGRVIRLEPGEVRRYQLEIEVSPIDG